MVEANLLEVKGVVSFTFEMKSGRVVVRSRTDVTVEALCAAIDSTKIMTAQQVVKDEHGQEVMLSFGSSPVRGAAVAVGDIVGQRVASDRHKLNCANATRPSPSPSPLATGKVRRRQRKRRNACASIPR